MTTYEVIQHYEVGAGGQASITLDNIDQTYTDLYLVCSLRGETGTDFPAAAIQFNSATTNYTTRYLLGSGSSPASGSTSTTYIRIGNTSGAAQTASTFGNISVYIPNYTSNNAKSVSTDAVSENNATAAYQNIVAGLWNSTSAITRIDLFIAGANMVQYSSATLYGIRKYDTSLAPKATGGAISFDAVNNKWVHVFTASGTFTPTENLTNVEYLVVAGGGGGGGVGNGGGGGAGGFRTGTGMSLTASTNYTVTVGGGGALDVNGSDSTFNAITSAGGGAGGRGNDAGSAGGSGGGGGYTNNGSYAGGAGNTPSTSPSQGNNGAASGNGGADQYSTGGGGGASAAGYSGFSSQGSLRGNGGAGTASSISGSSVTYAGGGGGGTNSSTIVPYGGVGGGANGGMSNASATLAGVNTGGGGGGWGAAGTVGDGAPSVGASGIVIVRYSA